MKSSNGIVQASPLIKGFNVDSYSYQTKRSIVIDQRQRGKQWYNQKFVPVSWVKVNEGVIDR